MDDICTICNNVLWIFSEHLAFCLGFTKYSISAWVNSLCLVRPARGAISLRKERPTCATPKGRRLEFCSKQYLKHDNTGNQAVTSTVTTFKKWNRPVRAAAALVLVILAKRSRDQNSWQSALKRPSCWFCPLWAKNKHRTVKIC